MPFVPQQGTGTGVLAPSALQKIWLKRQGSSSSESLKLAPITTVQNRNGIYNFFPDNLALRIGDPQNPINPRSLDAQAVPSSVRTATETYAIQRYPFGAQVVTFEEQEQYLNAAAEDFVATLVERNIVTAYQLHSYLLGQVLGNASTYADSAVNITVASDPSADIQGAVNTILLNMSKRGIDIQSGDIVATCNQATMLSLFNANQVFSTNTAIGAAWNGSAAIQARTNAVDPSQVSTFLATKTIRTKGVRLVVNDTYVQSVDNGTVTAVPAIADGKMAIFKVAEGLGGSGLVQTFCMSQDGALGKPVTYPSYNPEGTGLYIDCNFAIEVLGGNGSPYGGLLTGITS